MRFDGEKLYEIVDDLLDRQTYVSIREILDLPEFKNCCDGASRERVINAMRVAIVYNIEFESRLRNRAVAEHDRLLSNALDRDDSQKNKLIVNAIMGRYKMIVSVDNNQMIITPTINTGFDLDALSALHWYYRLANKHQGRIRNIYHTNEHTRVIWVPSDNKDGDNE